MVRLTVKQRKRQGPLRGQYEISCKVLEAFADLLCLYAFSGFFDVGSPLDWISVSPGGMPAVKDTSGKFSPVTSLPIRIS